MLENLFLFLVNRSISAGWLIFAVIILRLFLKRAPRKIVCFLWILAAVRLLIPFSPESAFSLIPSRDTFQLAEKEEMVTLPLTDITAGDKMQEDLQNVNTGYEKDSAGQRVLLIRTGFEKLDAALEWLLERSHGKTVSNLSKVEKEATDTKDERESSPENMDASSEILADENLLETMNSAETGNSVEIGNFVGTGNPVGMGNPAVIGNPSETRNPSENGILVGMNPEMQASPSLLEIAACVWLAGTVVLLSGSLLSYLLLRRKVRIYMEKTPGVRYCDEIDTPFILGLLCPKIYIPSNLGTAEKEYVLAHERAHLESWDSGRKAIGYVLLSIYWMNPLIWAGYALFCRDLEIACDERVIEGKDLAYRKAYAMALLSCSVPGRRIAAYPLAFGEVSVKKRIRSVLSYRKPRVWITVAGVLLCGIVLLCFLTDPEESGETFVQNSHGAEQIPLVSPGKWLYEDAYRSLYQTWTTGGGEEDAPFVQLHDFDGDEIPEMMLLDGTETLHIYSYSAEEKRVDTVAEMSVMGSVYCWGNVIAARTPEYHTVYFTYANGRYYTGIAHLGFAEIDQRWVTDEEFGIVFPVYVKGSLSNYNGMTGRAEKFGQFDLGNIVIEGQEQGESPFCLVSELEDLEDYYDVVNAYLSVRKGQGAGKQYKVVSGFIRGTCFADIFFEDEEGKVEQTVHYRYDEPYQYYDEQVNAYYLEFDKWPFTYDQEQYGEEWPIRWEDVDRDGYQDILFCMRIFQTGGNYGCFLYDPETNDYLPCKGFEEIPAPDLRYGDIRGMIRGGYTEFTPIYTHYKYEITEDLSVELVGRLEDLFMGADSYSYRYNEEHYENGVTVYKKENVEREEVDIDYWNGYID